MPDDLIPGTTDHFNWLLATLKPYWDMDRAFMARVLKSMGQENAASTLNRMRSEARRTTPPTMGEITALEATFWDNWHHTGGRKPRENKEANHDRARFKLEIEVWNAPVGTAMWGGGNKTQNSIFKGSAIAMDRKALTSYLKDKREGKKINKAWADDPDLASFADSLDALSDRYPDALIGPLCWTANKKMFVPGMAVMVENAGDAKSMVASIMFPDGYHALKRWTTKRANGTSIKGPNDELALQCRATNRIDQTAWRNEKLA